MNSLRKHLSYANVVATLALVFAMSGGALAASHYLINSTKQINPKVLKKLKGSGAIGPQGAPGTTGATGARGPAGANGAEGPKGAEGPAGLSALSTLPSGKTESGEYSMGAHIITSPEETVTGVTFPIPLKEAVATSHVVITNVSTPVPHCSGPGHADPGFVCIYNFVRFHVGSPTTFGIETSEASYGTGRIGFQLAWTSTAAGFAFDEGTYTVTAP